MRKKILRNLAGLLLPFAAYGAQASYGAYQRRSLSKTSGYSLPLSSPLFATPDRASAIVEAGRLAITPGTRTRELIVVDAGVQDRHIILKQARPGVDVVEIKAGDDGIAALVQALQGYQGLHAVHLVAHAEAGAIFLGGHKIEQQTLLDNVAAFAALNHAIREDGDLLLYGCDLAQGKVGDDFLEILRQNTHVDIAASLDKTGNEAQGGNWELEIRKGDIEAQLLPQSIALKDFSEILAAAPNATYTFQAGSGWVDGGANLTHTHFVVSAKDLSGAPVVNVSVIDNVAYLQNGYTSANNYFNLSADGVNTGSFELTGLTSGEYETGQFTNVRIVGIKPDNSTITSSTINGSAATGESFNFGAGQLTAFSGVKIKAFKLHFETTNDTAVAFFEFRSFTIANAQAPLNSDGSVTAATGVTEPVGLNTTVDTVGEAVDVFDFRITDGGTSDGVALTASQVVVHVSGTSTDADRGKITWRLNGPDASNVTGTYNAGADTITFSGLSISVANGGNETYTVNAYYNDNTGLVDGRTVVLSIDGDTDLTVGAAGTQMGSTSAVSNGTGTTIDVVATALAFTTQPAGSVSGVALTTQPVVTARDAFGNTDTGFTETVTLTEASAGALTNNTQAASAGVATFASLTYTATADQQSFTLTANDVDGTGSNLPTVDSSSLTSDVVATKLRFATEPVPTSILSGTPTSFSTVPVVQATNAGNIVDTGYNTGIVIAVTDPNDSVVDGTVNSLTGTGDTDGSGTTVTVTPTNGVSTFTGLSLTYTNGGAVDALALRATSGGLSAANSATIASDSNAIPVVISLDGDSAAFTEGDVALVLDVAGNATVTDANSVDFNGGNVTVAIVTNRVAGEDVLGIVNEGTGAGQIGVSGANVSFGGATIGTFAGGTGTNNLVITFNSASATPAAAQALLRKITYFNSNTGNPSTSTRTVRFTVNDGDGGASANSDVSVTVSAVNDNPSVTGLPASVAFTEDTSDGLNISAATFADPDSTSITITLTASAGTFVYASDGNVPAASLGGITTSTMTITGLPSTVNAYTVVASNITYIPAANANGTPAATITVTGSDVDGATNIALGTIDVNITAVNDAPTFTAGATLAAVDEDTANPAGATATSLFGANFSDVDTSDALAGIVVVADASNSGTQGKWQYSTDSGSTWFDVGSVSTAGGLLLDAGTGLRFLPVANFNGTPGALTVHAVDDSSATTFTSGSTRATFDTTADDATSKVAAAGVSLATSITAVNDAPTLTTIAALTGATEDAAFTITYATLAAAANEADIDVDALSFRVEAVSTGTLTKGGSAVTAGSTLLSTGEELVWTPAANANGTLNAFTVRAWDGLLASATAVQVQVDVAATAEPPAITAATTNEDTQTTSGLVISRGAGDGNEVTHFKITAITGGTLYQNDGTTAIAANAFITFAQGNAGLKFTPTLNANSGAGDTFSFAVQGATDNTGGGLGSATAATITVDAVNDDPGAAGVPSDVAVTEDTLGNFNLSAITLSDVDSASGNVVLTLTASAGAFTASSGGSVTVGGSSTGTLTLTGTIANVDAFLNTAANVKYTGASNAAGDNAATVALKINDGGNTGAGGGGDVALGTVNVDLTAVNDAPTISAPASIAVLEDVATAVLGSGLSFADNDAGGSSVVATFSVGSGTLAATSGGGVTVGGTATARTLTGSIADINTFIAGSNLTFTTAGNATANVTLTVAVDDGGATGLDPGATGTGSSEAASTTVTLAVTAVNDAPAGADDTITISEDVSHTFAAADFGFSDASDAPANTLLAVKITTLPGAGALTNNNVAISAGDFVPAADITGGKLVFTPVVDGSGTGYTSFTFQVQDNGGTSNSGVDVDPAANTITFDVTPTAETPTATNATTNEDTQTTSGLVLSRGAGDGNEVTHFKITAITGGTLYQNDGTTAIAGNAFITFAQGNAGLKFTPSLNLTTANGDTFAFVVQAGTDNTGGGLSATGATVAITVNAVNDAPVVTASGGTTAYTEGDNAATTIAVDSGLTVTDVDHTTLASATVTISANHQIGEDVLAFANNGSTMGNVAVAGSYDDANGVLTLTSAGATATKAEWQAALRAVTYSNSSNAPNTTNRTITFKVNDGALDSADSSKTLSVAAVNDTPIVVASGGTTAFTEANNVVSTPVIVDGSVTVSDLDSATLASATVTITANLVDTEDVLAFTNDGSTMGDIAGGYTAGTGTLALTSAGAPTIAQWQAALRAVTYTNSSNTPDPTNRTVSFVVNDGGTNSAAGTQTVSVTATNDTPTDIALSAATINQSAGINGVVGTLSATDLDDAAFTFTLVAGTGATNNGLFNISGTTFRASNAGTIPGGTYSARVQADDGDIAGTFEKAFSITVVDDVAPVAPATPDLVAGSDTGTSSTDDITNDTTPTFSGTAEVNSTVEVFRGGTTSLGTTTADGTGAWTLTSPALTAGTYSITARATDAATLTSVASGALAVTIDTSAPTLQAIARQSPSTINTDAATVTWRAIFDGAIGGLDASDFQLTAINGSPSGTIGVVTPVSASIYDVTVGSLGGQGRLRLDLKASGTNIQDVAGNALAAGGFTTGDFYYVGVTSVFDTLSLATGTTRTVSGPTTDKVAQRFTTAAASPLSITTVIAALGAVTGTPTPVVTIYTDVANAPGVQVVTALTNPASLAPNALNTWTSTTLLTANTTYWVVFADTSGAGAYEINETAATSGGSGTWLNAGDYIYYHGANAATGPQVGALQLALGATSIPTITSTLAAGASYGSGFSYQIAATNLPTSFTASGLPNGLTLAPATGAITGAPTQSGAFNVTLTATNGSGTSTPATLVVTVAKASLTITANSVTRGFGQDNPALSVSYAGFVNSESPVVLSSPAVVSTTATATSPLGTYPITVSGAAASNYNIGFVAGVLTVGAGPQTISFTIRGSVSAGETVTLSATASSGLPVTFSLVSGPATISGANVTLTGTGTVTVRASQAGNASYAAATSVDRSFQAEVAPPAAVTPPVAGGSTTITAPTGGAGSTYQWQRNGDDLTGATNPTLTLNDVQPPTAGLYTYTATIPGGGGGTSDPVIVGITTEEKVIGTGELVGLDIVHPNGNTYDQVLLEGPAATVTASQSKVTRISFIDLTNDIVQVELSGAGTLSVVMDDASTPAPAVNYNQSEVDYVRGHAGLVITGANETTNISVFSVGPVTAVNQALFQAGTTYDGVADLAFIAIQSTNGKFGGIRTGNTHYFATTGFTGVYAPGVEFAGPVNIGDVNAFDSATPVLVFGSAGDVQLTGGSLFQTNGQPVTVSGITKVRFVAGTTSQGTALPAQANQGVLVENGIDVTAQLVVNP